MLNCIKNFTFKLILQLIIISSQVMSIPHFLDAEWRIETVDSTGIVGWDNSISVNKNNNPHITFIGFDGSNNVLKYAYWTGASWNVETVDSTCSKKAFISTLSFPETNSKYCPRPRPKK